MTNAKPTKDTAQAERLRRLRKVLGYETAFAFAQFLDVEYKRYNNFERGLPLSRDIATKIVQKVPGMTLDWLYLERTSGLPQVLFRELEAAREGNSTTSESK